MRRLLWLLLGGLMACDAETGARPGATDGADTGSPVTDTAAPDDLADWACTPDPSVTWAGFTDGFMSTYCRACHSETTPDRRGAPVGVDFSDRAETLAWASRLKARVLDSGDMPLGGGVVDDDLMLFEGWLCHQVQRSGGLR